MDPSQSGMIDDAARMIRSGGLVAFPTETVYGLGADALNPDAVRAVFALKGRPSANPLIVHVPNTAAVAPLVKPGAWDWRCNALAGAFWPGPLTIVLPKSSAVPYEATAGGETVALRCPKHPVAAALLKAAGVPLVGPSANRSGRVSPTTAAHVAAEFGPALPVLDGGACETGIESTVLWMADNSPRVLRPGVIGAAEIERVIGQPVQAFTRSSSDAPDDDASIEPPQPLPSPGLLESHYAPVAPVHLFSSDDPDAVDRILSRAASAESGRRRIGVMVIGQAIAKFRAILPRHDVIALPADAPTYAARLYSTLRALDQDRCEAIYIERSSPPSHDPHAAVWEAINDRLRRAASPRN